MSILKWDWIVLSLVILFYVEERTLSLFMLFVIVFVQTPWSDYGWCVNVFVCMVYFLITPFK